MGPLKLLVGWPLLSLRAVVGLAQTIQEEAEREATNPASVRRDLERIQQQLDTGQISEAEAARAQEESATRFTQRRASRTAVAAAEES
jgi:Skp family chaperone for outer membrane proteins